MEALIMENVEGHAGIVKTHGYLDKEFVIK